MISTVPPNLSDKRAKKLKSQLRDLCIESEMQAERRDDLHPLKPGFLTVMASGEYTDEIPYRDYPVVKANDGMVAQIVGGWIDREVTDIEYEQIDGVAWVFYIAPE